MSRITEDGGKARSVYMNVAGHELMNPNKQKGHQDPQTNINLNLNVNATVNLNINGVESPLDELESFKAAEVPARNSSQAQQNTQVN